MDVNALTTEDILKIRYPRHRLIRVASHSPYIEWPVEPTTMDMRRNLLLGPEALPQPGEVTRYSTPMIAEVIAGRRIWVAIDDWNANRPRLWYCEYGGLSR